MYSSERKKILTVDFDDTLATTTITGWGGTSLQPVERVLNFVRKKAQQGWEIHIVSFRSEKDRQEMVDFVRGYKLPIKTITCTNSKNKTPFLKNLSSSLHIDDNVQVCTLAVMAGVECLLVDHGQEATNSMASVFDKI